MTPMHCAVVPTIGQVSGHRFIDTGYDMYVNSVNTPNRIYVSEPAAGEMARMFGWTSPGDTKALRECVEALEAEIAAAQAARDDAVRQLAAVRVLKQGGYVQANPPGRPKKTPAAA